MQPSIRRTWLENSLRERQTVLLSATLAKSEDEDLQVACRRMGFHQIEQVSVSPAIFGMATFRLADRTAPPPFDEESSPNPAFFDYGAELFGKPRSRAEPLSSAPVTPTSML